MSRTLCRLAVTTATTAAVAALALAPSPALASSMWFSKSSGTIATASWLEIGELAGVAGNAHFGDLHVEDLGRGRATAFGNVFDVTCEDGVTPYVPFGGHGDEPVDDGGGCVLEGIRFVEGDELRFSVDRKLTSAQLTGTLAVSSGHGEGPTGTPAVAITWTGVGEPYSSVESGRYTDETGTYSYRYTFSGRQAVIAEGSRIGGMVFDDEEGESSDASIGKYRSVSRSRS